MQLVYQGAADRADPGGHPGRAARAPSTSCASASTSWASPSPRSRPRAATRSPSACRTSRTPPAPRSWSAPPPGWTSTTGRPTRSRPNGKTVASQLQTQDPDRDRDQPGRREPRRRGSPARAAWRSTTRSSWRPSSRRRAGTDNARIEPRVLHVRGARQRRVPDRRQGQRAHAAVRAALPARPAPTTTEQDLIAGPADRRHRPRAQILDGPARDRRAAGRAVELLQADPVQPPRRRSSSSSRTTSRCSATTSPTRSRAPTSAGSPDVSFGFTRRGNKAFQNVTGDDRPPRPARQPRSASSSTSTSRSRSTPS